MTLDTYKLEIPGGSIEILAQNDSEAQIKANRYIIENNIRIPKLKLFRYPKEYVREKTNGLIEVY